MTFNKKISARSVALAGDVFDPSGTLTGGMVPLVLMSILLAHTCTYGMVYAGFIFCLMVIMIIKIRAHMAEKSWANI